MPRTRSTTRSSKKSCETSRSRPTEESAGLNPVQSQFKSEGRYQYEKRRLSNSEQASGTSPVIPQPFHGRGEGKNRGVVPNSQQSHEQRYRVQGQLHLVIHALQENIQKGTYCRSLSYNRDLLFSLSLGATIRRTMVSSRWKGCLPTLFRQFRSNRCITRERAIGAGTRRT